MNDPLHPTDRLLDCPMSRRVISCDPALLRPFCGSCKAHGGTAALDMISTLMIEAAALWNKLLKPAKPGPCWIRGNLQATACNLGD
jgi:hypothetical protein